MSNEHVDLVQRHSLTDEQWNVLQPLIVYPPIGRPPENERRTISGILWILKTGAPWRDLPTEFARYNNTVGMPSINAFAPSPSTEPSPESFRNSFK